MAITRYVKWLAKVTVPADDHGIWRLFDMTGPDDELFMLEKFFPMHNPDMRIVGDLMRFDTEKEYDAARLKIDAEMKEQQGWKASGKLDSQLTQEQMDSIKKSRDAALEKARGPHKRRAEAARKQDPPPTLKA